MAEHGIGDFLAAKRKAAERLGVEDGAAMLPKNSEIEAALAEYQRLFGGESHVDGAHRAAPRGAVGDALPVGVRAAPGGRGAVGHRHRSTPRCSCTCSPTAPSQ